MIKVNKAGADWIMIRNWIGSEIDALRSALEKNMDVLDTANCRGQIAAYRKLLNEADPQKTPTVEAENYG